MPAIRQDQAILRLTKQVNDIWSALRRVTVNLPLFDIANENTPSQITADQNNYVPGNYDILRLESDQAGRTITGFDGGVKGRFLRLFNVGSYEIILAHQSASSDPENRIISPVGFDIVVNAGGEIALYYDSTQEKWRSSYSSNAERISAEVRLTADYSVADATYTGIQWDDEISDTGNFWSAGDPFYFVIPETGWYYLECEVIYDVDPNGFREVQLFESTLSKPLVWMTQVAVTAGQTLFTLSHTFYAPAGEKWGVEAWQNSGGALDVIRRRAFSTAYLYTRMTIVKLS